MWKINGRLVLDGDAHRFILDSLREGSKLTVVDTDYSGLWWLQRWYFALRLRFYVWRLNRTVRRYRADR